MKGHWARGAQAIAALCFAVALPDCRSDDEASLQGARQGVPLAVGAYQRLSAGDACRGGGKINFCSTERLVTLDALVSFSPEIAEVVPAEAFPGSAATGATHYVLGVAPGKAKLHFSGTFDDGSVRSADLEVEVRKADRAVASSNCHGVETSTLVTRPGGALFFEVKLFSGATELAGWHPDAVVPGAGLVRSTAFDSANHFTWTAPTEPASVDLRSGLVPQRLAALQAYGAADVTDIVVGSPNGTSLVFWSSGSTRIDATTKVRGVEPCDVAPVIFKTETPGVCTGPGGAETWPAEDEYGGFVDLVAEGTCRISASMDGVRFFRPASIRLFLVAEPTGEKFDGFNEPCAVEGSTSCTYGDTSTVTLCKNGRWAHGTTCGPSRTCDARDPALDGCVAGGPCSECRVMR
jgi:hypothetical protein